MILSKPRWILGVSVLAVLLIAGVCNSAAADSVHKAISKQLVSNQSGCNIVAVAASGQLVAPMQLGSDPSTSTGQYVVSTVSNLSATPPPLSGTGSDTLAISIPTTGTYYFWTRVKYSSSSSDSFWLEVDGNGSAALVVGNEANTVSPYGSWHWVAWPNAHDQAPGSTHISVLLTAGQHQIQLIGREAGTEIDEILLTSAASFIPGGTISPGTSGCTSPSPSPITTNPSPSPTTGGFAGVKFVGSVDTMKLSKDQAGGGFTSGDAQAVDLAATMAATHVTVNTPIEDASVMGGWANRIHGDGKHVWFRLSSTNCNQPHGDVGDGYPNFKPGYLTTLHNLMLANPGFFKGGDLFDGDAETENSCWWADHYGCGVQSSCTPCNTSGTNTPCAPVYQFNNFLVEMTNQANQDLASLGISGVTTTVHSTDPGTATNQLYPSTVQAMGNMITVDTYPDQNTTDPTTAANSWVGSLNAWHQSWLNKGINVKILVGEWGYSNAINVDDATQEAVIKAETQQAFPSISFLLGTNYWVGPGVAGDGGYTQIFYLDASGRWQFRPAANDVSTFFATMNQ